MYGAPRKNEPLTQEQIDQLAMVYIQKGEFGIKDFNACGIDRKINHDERDAVHRRVESLGTELLKRYIRPNFHVEYNEYR